MCEQEEATPTKDELTMELILYLQDCIKNLVQRVRKLEQEVRHQ